MKNASRISARRVLQGGAAFAALGALTLAAAPAHADTDQVGWAHANVAGGLGVAQTFITQSETDTNSFSGAVESFLTLDASTVASVGADGVTATTTVNSGRIQVTLDDLDDILAEDEDEDEDEGEVDTEPEDDEDDGDDDTPEGDEDETEAPVESEPTEEPGTPTEEPGDPVEPEPTEGPEDSDTPGSEDDEDEEDEEAGAAGVIDLDETNSVLTDGGDDIVLDVTITGATISTTQGWDGSISRVAEADYVENHNPFGISINFYSVEDVWQVEEEGYDWNDAYTALVANFEFPEVVDFHYPVGEAVAGVGVPVEGGNGGGGNGGDNDGDDKTPPKVREGDELPKPDPKTETKPLAQTGSPLVGLIAAGAAIAAGGGAAAYLARRKKNNEEVAETETDETNEN